MTDQVRRVLLYGQRPFPTDHAVLEVVFAKHLPARGYEAIWIMQPATRDLAGTERVWHSTRVHLTRRRYWSGMARHLELGAQYVRLGGSTIRHNSVQIVQARTGLPEALAAWWLGRRFGKPFVYQYSFPTSLARRSLLERSGRPRLAAALYWLEDSLTLQLMKRASLALAISDEMTRLWAGRGVSQVVTFPLGADTSVDPRAVQPIDAPPNTVIYFGSMDEKRELDFLLESFRLVRQRCAAHLLMLGDVEHDLLVARARALRIDGAMTFVPRVPRADVPRYVCAARCSVAPIPPRPFYVQSSATKVVESLALAVPVVANREIPDQRQLIEASRGGETPPYETAAFASAIVRLLENPREAREAGWAGRAYVLKHRSYSVLSDRLKAHYDSLLD